MSQLLQAVKNYNLGDVQRYLRTESPNSRDTNHQTALHLACGVYANLEIASLLVENKADVNIQEKKGNTPLHFAAQQGNLSLCKLLLNVENIKLEIVNKDKLSVLHYLIQILPDYLILHQYKEILQLYIDKGGKINTKSKYGETPLHKACIKGNMIGIFFLLKNNVEMNTLNKFV